MPRLVGLCDTEWVLETTSSCGATVLVTKTMPSHTSTIGSANRWIIRGRNGGISGWSTRGAASVVSLMRTCPGNRRRRSLVSVGRRAIRSLDDVTAPVVVVHDELASDPTAVSLRHQVCRDAGLR